MNRETRTEKEEGETETEADYRLVCHNNQVLLYEPTAEDYRLNIEPNKSAVKCCCVVLRMILSGPVNHAGIAL